MSGALMSKNAWSIRGKETGAETFTLDWDTAKWAARNGDRVTVLHSARWPAETAQNALHGREREAAERERAAGYFGAPHGIADLPRRQWRSRAGTAVAVVLIVVVAIAVALVAKGLAS